MRETMRYPFGRDRRLLRSDPYGVVQPYTLRNLVTLRPLLLVRHARDIPIALDMVTTTRRTTLNGLGGPDHLFALKLEQHLCATILRRPHDVGPRPVDAAVGMVRQGWTCGRGIYLMNHVGECSLHHDPDADQLTLSLQPNVLFQS